MCNIGHAQIIILLLKWQFICLGYIINLTDSNERLVIAEVILPLAIGQAYSFSVPQSLESQIAVGQRVQVQFGKKRMYAGIVYNLTDSVAHDSLKFKEVLAILDEKPILTKRHMDFWNWIADYYACHLGEVMISALPSGLKLSSDTIVVKNFEEIPQDVSDEEYLILEALTFHQEIPIATIEEILNKKNVYKAVNNLLDQKLICLKEELQNSYKPKLAKFVDWGPDYIQPESQTKVFDAIKNESQVRCLLGMVQLTRVGIPILKRKLMDETFVKPTTIDQLVKKGILAIVVDPVSRLSRDLKERNGVLAPLSTIQEVAYAKIIESWNIHNITLLHGVTGSGKTRLFAELILKHVPENGQVLYLLPEITLATQLTQRLKAMLGDDIVVYHSRINQQERVEIWHAAFQGRKIIIGPRSSVFLPFINLDLVIIDEEHDPSYKQQDPAPRYNGRDAALVLAKLFGAKTLLATATPSIETYTNAMNGKYGYVLLAERYGDAELPKIELVDLKAEIKKNTMVRVFAASVFEEINANIQENKQVIIFQNRRGFAPIYECQLCLWKAHCINCDTSLIYHKYSNKLKCHYCGYQETMVPECPSCLSEKVELKGIGTEQIENDLSILFPDVVINRLDYETTRSRKELTQIIGDFEQGLTKILVGTQMLAKGLDFSNVGLVVIVNADQLLAYPDFRVNERAFQLMTQVSGRAGRQGGGSKVMIQAANIEHPVFAWVIGHDFESFYEREIKERHWHFFPPYSRMSRIIVKHKNKDVLTDLLNTYLDYLNKNIKGEWQFFGPILPPISRIQGFYLQHFVIKAPKTANTMLVLKHIKSSFFEIAYKTAAFRQAKAVFDIDPY